MNQSKEALTLTAEEALQYGNPPADDTDLGDVPMEPSGDGDGKPSSNGHGKPKRKAAKRRPRPGSVLTEDGIPSVLLDEGRTDLANARRLVAIHGDDIRFCPQWGWLDYGGTRWAVNDLQVEARAKDVCRYVWRQLSMFGEDGGKALSEIYRFARATANAPGQRNLLRLAQSERGVAITPDDLNRDPFALNCINGTVDLRTSEIRPHRREDLLTQLCPTPYVPTAECPEYVKFIRKIMADNPDLIGFIQRALGMSLTGAIRDHVLLVAYGTGQNGKSTLFNAVLDTVGPDYAMKAPLGLLMAKQNEQHPTERADLYGKRPVFANEVDDGQRLSESLVKELTGGDPIRARFMRKDFFEFRPSHHLWLAVNHKPTIRGTDTGIWRRIRLIPFAVSIPEEEQDKRLPEKLQRERAGILAWMVRGAMEWAEHGLGEPDEVRMATAEYRDEQDVLATFLAERCEVNSYFQVKKSSLYAEYAKWAEQAGEYVLPARRFGQAIVEKGFQRFTSNGTWYRGIGLRDTTHEQ